MAQRSAARDRLGGHVCGGVGDAGGVQPPGSDPVAPIGRFPSRHGRGDAPWHPDLARDGAGARRGCRSGRPGCGARDAGGVSGPEGRHRRIGGESHPRYPGGDARDGACLVTSLRDWLGFRRRDSAGDTVLLIAREVTDRQRSVQGGLAEIRDPSVLDRLTAEDFEGLDLVIEEQADEDREYAVVLARLTYAAARAKGFDDQIVDAALRLDTLLPGDDPSHERERLLRDAYAVAQRAGYVEGGRAALSRLGLRALDAGDTERARALLRQQLELGDEEDDDIAEVNAALALGDLLRKEGERTEAQALFRRAGRGAQRLDYQHGIAEALVRQIEMLPRNTDLETMAALQRQASEAARRTADLGLQNRIVISLAETLRRNGKIPEAVAQLEEGLVVSRQIGDLAMEARGLPPLAELEPSRGRVAAAANHERELSQLEDRRGNRGAASDWSIRSGTSLLDLDEISGALEAFNRA